MANTLDLARAAFERHESAAEPEARAEESTDVESVEENLLAVPEADDPAVEVEAGEAEVTAEVADDEVEAASDEAGEEAASEGLESYSVNGLAEAIGWEAGELYERLEIKLDETGEPVKLGEIKDILQSSRREVEEARQLKAQAENVIAGGAQIGEGMQQMDAEVQQAGMEYQKIQALMDEIDWDRLKQEDPTRYVMVRTDYREKLEEAGRKLQYAQGTAEQRAVQANQQMLMQAQAQMMEMIPAWEKDQNAMQHDQGLIRDMLLQYGYDDNTIAGIRDPRAVKLFYDLVQFKAGTEAQAQAVEQVKSARKAPTPLRGKGRVKVDPKAGFRKQKEALKDVRPGERKHAEFAAAKALFKSAGL